CPPGLRLHLLSAAEAQGQSLTALPERVRESDRPPGSRLRDRAACAVARVRVATQRPLAHTHTRRSAQRFRSRLESRERRLRSSAQLCSRCPPIEKINLTVPAQQSKRLITGRRASVCSRPNKKGYCGYESKFEKCRVRSDLLACPRLLGRAAGHEPR